MNAQNQNLNTTAEAKPHYPTMAAEHMGRRLLDLHVDALKLRGFWQTMTEEQQKGEVDRATMGIQCAVAAAVNTIATQGHTAIAAQLKSTANEKEIKAVFIVDRGNDHDAMVELLLAQSGSRCQILLTSAEPYIGGMEDLIYAEPNQHGLFDSPPEDNLMWGINTPIFDDVAYICSPSRKLAEMYASAIRNKILESDQGSCHWYANYVYASPYQNSLERFEELSKINHFGAMVNWFNQFQAGDINLDSVNLEDFIPDLKKDGAPQVETEVVVDSDFFPDHEIPTEPAADEPDPEESQDESFHTPESVQFDEPQPDELDAEPAVTLKPGIAVDEIVATVRMKGDYFVASCLGHQSKSKMSVDIALSGLSNKLGLTGNIHHEEITTEQDKDAQVRHFTIKADQE